MSSWELSSIVVAGKYLGLAALLCLGLGVVVALFYGVARINDRRRPAVTYRRAVLDALPYVLAVTLIGGLCGQLGGGSREGVVGNLLPAVLGIFGGFTAYYLGAKRDRSGKVAVNTLAFLIGFFALYNVSAVWRQSNENWAFCRDLYSSNGFETQAERDEVKGYWKDYCAAVFKTATQQGS
ncbi:MAG: hypothetical protein EOP22_16355 [Hyphomicrobiales bacterium]|nr:MAG: hypothetical protein EOP22_16355 [Hyphomicrobiales bacterium]